MSEWSPSTNLDLATLKSMRGDVVEFRSLLVEASKEVPRLGSTENLKDLCKALGQLRVIAGLNNSTTEERATILENILPLFGKDSFARA